MPDKSWYGNAWDVASKPLTDYLPDALNPTKLGATFADYLDQPSLEEPATIPFSGGATWKGLGAGAIQGIGEALSGFTSPVNAVPMMLSSGSSLAASKGIPAIAKAMSLGSKIASAPTAIHGAEQMFSPESNMGERGMGVAELAGGLLGMKGSAPKTTPGVPVKKSTEIPYQMPEDIPTTRTKVTNEIMNRERSQGVPDNPIAQQLEAERSSVPVKSNWADEVLNPNESPSQGFDWPEAGGRYEPDASGSHKLVQSTELTPELFDQKKTRLYELIDRDKSGTLTTPELAEARLLDKELRDRNFERPEPKVDKSNVPETMDNEFERQYKSLSEGLPEPEVVHDTGGPPEGIEPQGTTVTNASGESMASQEAMSRQSGMKDRGEQFVVFDRAGNERPLIGPEAVDYTPRKGETYGIKQADGSFKLLDDQGGRVPDHVDMTMESTGPTNQPDALDTKLQAAGLTDLERGKIGKGILDKANEISPNEPIGHTIDIPTDKSAAQVMKDARSKGYEYAGVNDDGSFKFKKVNEGGTKIGPLETEIGNQRGKLGANIDEKKNSTFANIASLPRTLEASIDLSAPLRQGLGLIHKSEFWRALPSMVRAFGSENVYNDVMKSISERPLFRERVGKDGKMIPSFAHDMGLKLSDLTDITRREESMMSNLAEKIPLGVGKGVRASERAYTVFLNKLRADTFESLMESSKVFGQDGKANVPLAKAMAEFVNNASGRGSLGQFESSAATLNQFLFSPRLIASRLNMLNPRNYIFGPPEVRKEYLKSLFGLAGAAGLVTGISALGGGKVEKDPSSADFGKLKIGNTRIDPYGGFQQYITAAQRLAPEIPGLDKYTGKMKSTNTNRKYDLYNPKFGQSDQEDIGIKFVRGKEAPLVAFAHSILAGKKEISGKKMNFTTTNPFENSISKLFIPMLIQDVYSLAKNEPKHLGWAIPATFGMGVQQYDKR